MQPTRTGIFRSRQDRFLDFVAVLAVIGSVSAFYLRSLADEETRLHGFGRTWIFHPGEVDVRTADDRIVRHELPTHNDWIPFACIAYLTGWLGRNICVVFALRNARPGGGPRGFPIDPPG